MTIARNIEDYSKGELLEELKKLQLQFNLLKSAYEKDMSEKKHIEENLSKRTALLSAFSQYTIDLAEQVSEKRYQFIVNKCKELFNVRAVWISTYNEKLSELVVEASTTSEDDNSILIKYLGKTVKRFRTPVDAATYKLMVETGINSHSSLNELSFGQIPEFIGSAIGNIFGIGWFQGVSLIEKGNLSGTLVIAGFKGQEELENEIVSVFAKLTSTILKRKQAEEKLLASEEKFRKAFITSPDAVNINRIEDGKYILINTGFTKISGYSEEEVIGKTSLELNIWENPDDRVRLINDLKEKGEVENLETTFVMKDGSIRNGIMSATIIDLDGIPHILSITRDITDRKYAEIALKGSENKYRELIELAVDGILTGSSDGTIIGANSFMLILTGRSLNELLGMNISELFSADKLIDLPLRFDLLQKGETIINERDIIRPDGIKVPIEMHTKMMPDGTYQSIFHDISKRKLADELLRENQQMLQNVLSNFPGVVFWKDKQSNFLGCNQSFAVAAGLKSPLEIIGKTDFDLPWGKTEAMDYRNDDRLVIDSGKPKLHIIEMQHRDDCVIWLDTNKIPLRDSNGEIIGIMGVSADITDLKLTEGSLKESEERYRELFLNNPVPTYIFDTESFEFVEVNDAMVENYGYTREEFALMTLRDIRIPEEVDDMIKNVRESGKEAFHSTSMYHRKKDGTVFPVEITSHYLTEKNGRETRLVIVIDISERVKAAEHMKLAMEKAEASDRLKTSFLNNISHEVRTPLNGILGFAEIMSQTDLSKQELSESLSMLHESSNRLLDTITNYMDISLLTSGNMTVHKKDFIPAEELKNICEFYKTICSDRKVNLYLEVPAQSENIIVNSDPEIFNKILTQLVSNAIKFTKKGSITIGFDKAGDKLEFFVKDTGIGIGKDSLRNIFDRFVKLDMNQTVQTEGSGLGLSIVKGMSDIIGGDIRVESEMEVGSEFVFSIPFVNKKVIASSVASGREPKRSLSQSLILIAEDDDINYFYLNALIKQETPAKIIHARNGKEAIDLFKSNPDINLVLMDMKMPEIDGFEATRQIKLLNSNINIIAITAYAMSGDDERIIAAGCDGYLSKPISKKSLFEKIGEFIKI